jgi:hypothetical protein
MSRNWIDKRRYKKYSKATKEKTIPESKTSKND